MRIKASKITSTWVDVGGRLIETGATLKNASVSGTGNRRLGKSRFIALALTGGTGALTGRPPRFDPIATRAEEHRVAEAAPEAVAAFIRSWRVVRGSITDTAAGRVLDGADVFQDAALAALAPEDDETPDEAADRATARIRRRLDRRAAPATLDGAPEPSAPASLDSEEAARQRVCDRALAVWSRLGKRDRERVRRALDGATRTAGSVLAALASAGFALAD